MVGRPSGTRRRATENAGKRAVWSSSASMCTSEPRGYGVPYRTAWSVWVRQGSPLREHPRHGGGSLCQCLLRPEKRCIAI